MYKRKITKIKNGRVATSGDFMWIDPCVLRYSHYVFSPEARVVVVFVDADHRSVSGAIGSFDIGRDTR